MVSREDIAPLAPSAPMDVALHFLSNDCHACKCDGYWIILSTSQDRYLCVTHADLSAIGHRLSGWVAGIATNDRQPNCQNVGLIASLISKRVITPDPSRGKPFEDSNLPAMERSMEMPAIPVGRSPVRLTRFFSACWSIAWRLRTASLSSILARIERRRRSAESKGIVANLESSAELVAVFKSLRPLYPRPYLCLFDSLAQLEFLAAFGHCPRLVFGVVADPFQAHCWLQERSVVLNDDLERVRKFKPILSV
jgi:hypothetical protein